MGITRAASVVTALAVVVAGGLAGCTAVVTVDAADGANDPGCAEVTVRLPEDIEQLERRETDAQATGAWGEPVAVLLRCGVEVPGPSTLPCVEPPDTGIQWLRDTSEAPIYRFTTYGRDPAVTVTVDSEAIAPGIVLVELADAVSFLPRNGRACASLEDLITGESAG